jgi:hypothetical protein
MNQDNDLCRLKLKLADDESGCHVYIWACQDCHKEYGPEYIVPHGSTSWRSDQIPTAIPGRCSHRRASALRQANRNLATVEEIPLAS